MNKTNKKIFNLFLRYFTIIILALSNLYLLQKTLLPLTLHTTNIIINVFTPTTLTGNVIQFSQTTIQIITPCAAPAAFFLLISLIFGTASIKPKTRLKAILMAVVALFTLNIIRILILSTLTSSPNFETIHWIFWHIISTLFVIATYIATIKFYKIKSIPIISDFKFLSSLKK